MRATMHGRTVVRTYDDDPEKLLEDFEEGHPMPGATREDARRRKLVGSLPHPRYQIERDGALWRVWDSSPDEESTAAMGPGGALAAALRNASNDAASRTDDADDRRIAADQSQAMP